MYEVLRVPEFVSRADPAGAPNVIFNATLMRNEILQAEKPSLQ